MEIRGIKSLSIVYGGNAGARVYPASLIKSVSVSDTGKVTAELASTSSSSGSRIQEFADSASDVIRSVGQNRGSLVINAQGQLVNKPAPAPGS